MNQTCKILYTEVDDEGVNLTESLELEGHDGTVRTVCITSEDNPKVISAGQDNFLKVWDSSTGHLTSDIRGYHSHIYSIKALLDANTVFAVGADRFIQQFDLRVGKVANRVSTSELASMNYIATPQSAFTENFKDIFVILDMMSRTRAGKVPHQDPTSPFTLMIAHQDGSVSEWDQRTMTAPVSVLQLHAQECRSVEFDPSTRYVATSSFDSTSVIFDLVKRTTVATVSVHTDKTVLAKWHPFFPLLLTTSADCTVRVSAPKLFVDTY